VADTLALVRRDTSNPASLPPSIRRLIAEGRILPATRNLHEVLREIGHPPGPVSDAGTRALQEQRGERA
jgi:hypothetical protein